MKLLAGWLVVTWLSATMVDVRADPAVSSSQSGSGISDAQAFDAAALRRETEAAVQLSGGLAVRASASALREGESLVLTVEVPRAGYLNVVSINPEGVPTVLFPNQMQGDNQVAAGPFTLPTARMPFELRATAPFGPSLVAAFLTREPLNLYANGEGARVQQFARLSALGRDIITALSTKNLVVAPQAAPLAGGMTTVMVCARSGPCTLPGGGPTAANSPLARIADALIPGIFLEPEDKELEAKSARLPLRPMSDKGLRLTKVSEGFVPRLYEDVAGYCGIAYGHLIKRAGCGRAERASYPRGISEPGGSQLLMSDMARAQRAVMSLVQAPLTDGQYAALCDFAYNVGTGNLKRSTLLRAVNAGEHHRVPFQLRRWSRAGNKVYRGLQTRREREIALYFEGELTPTIVPKGEDVAPIDIRSGEPPR